MTSHRLSTTISVSAVMLLALAACAPDDVGTDPEPEATGAETVTETAEAQEPTAKPEDTEQTEEPEVGPPEGLPSGGAPQVDDADLPGGESVTGHYSEAGVEVGVAGLDPDDAPLEVHALPGEDSEVVAELLSTDAVVLAGRERIINTSTEDESPSIWAEVQLADGHGWVPTAYVYHFGATEDVTETYIDDVPPTEESRALAESVGERASGGEPGQDETEEDPDATDLGPDWVVITEPEDYGEEFYRVDLTGQQDDSVAGDRFFVYVEEQADGYQLTQVEATALCSRGVTDDGLCN